MHTGLKLLLLLSFVEVLAACSTFNSATSFPDSVEWVRHTEWSTGTRLTKWSETKGPTSLFVGFVRPEDREIPPDRRTNLITKFQIQAGQPFTTLLILKSGYVEPYPVLVSVFLDYMQVNFSLDDQRGLLHYLEIMPGVDMEIPVEVPIETSGWHDLFVVAFRVPDDHPTDQPARLQLGVGGLRTVICASDCALSAQSVPEALVGQGADVHNFNARAFPLLPDDGTPPKHRRLFWAQASAGEMFELELWARNPNNELRDYLVLPLLDFQQTSFAGSKMLHLQMPSGSELLVPGSVQVPIKTGVHELQFLYISDPYHSLDGVTDSTIQSALRSALVIESNP